MGGEVKMYKVLVVDDEKWVRKGIIQKLKSDRFGFSWIGEAEDGVDALPVLAKEHPDIVITDIRMDSMDGIEFIRQALEIYSDIEFIIISGYAEFEYAEQAINMGVSGYLLKPIQDESFYNTLEKAILAINRKHDIERMKDKEVILEKDNNALKLQQVVYQLLNIPENLKERNLETADLTLFGTSPFYILAILNLDSSSYYFSSFKYQDSELTRFAVKNIVCELGEKKNIFIFDNQKDINQILLLFYSQHESDLRILSNRFIMEVYTNIVKHLKIDITIGVSSVCNNISSNLYKQARDAFDLRLVYGSNNIFRYENVKISEKFSIPEHKLKLLQNCMEHLDFSNIEIVLKDIFSPKYMSVESGSYIRFMYSEILNMLMKMCSKLDINLGNNIDFSMLSGDAVNYFDNTGKIVDYIFKTIIKVLQPTALLSVDRKGLINRIKEHIEKHYSDELSVSELSRIYAINADYLSTLYKQEVGKPIIKHLTEIRIENACKLIRETGLSMIDVSKNVGYSDPQYFYKVFKKITGKTPAEYRSEV